MYVLYGTLALAFFKKSRRILRRHLVMIRSQGIDPHGTPTSRKLEMLGRLRWFVGLAVLLFIGSTLLVSLRIAPYWLSTFFAVLVNAGLYGTMCWFCRIRSKMSANYGDEASAYVVNDDDLREWKPGMILPPLPKAAHSASEIHPEPQDLPRDVCHSPSENVDDQRAVNATEPEETTPSPGALPD
jgi:hypothetical protein